MEKRFCDSCGAEVEEGSVFCGECGNKMEDCNKVEVIMPAGNVVCPHCGSDNVQSYSVAYQSGISDVTSNTVGIGYAGKFGVGAAKTNSVSVSAMAASTAPPHKKSVVKTFLIYGFLSIFLAAIIQGILPKALSFVGFVAFLLGPFLAYRNFKWNKDVWPQLYEDWSNSWVCLKCNHRFIQ